MSSMVERVAKVMFLVSSDNDAINEDGEDAWAMLGDYKQEYWLELARAALSALREPTDAMWDAGHAALEIHGDSARASCWAFVAMIDAALAESEK